MQSMSKCIASILGGNISLRLLRDDLYKVTNSNYLLYTYNTDRVLGHSVINTLSKKLEMKDQSCPMRLVKTSATCDRDRMNQSLLY